MRAEAGEGIEGELAGDGAAAPSSPMVAQYEALRLTHPGALLFFRMGDFYELFFEDAVVAAAALDIALTKRGRHRGQEIPMCGVPAHNAEPYLHKLIRKGFKVAICEQIEDPALARKRPGRSLVRRDVVRIVTPGTLTEDGLLEARAHNYLAALARSEGRLGLAWVDLSTGEFCTEPLEPEALAAALARLEPGELLVPQRVFDQRQPLPGLADWAERLSPIRDAAFDSQAGERRLAGLLGLATIAALGDFSRAELGAAGALVDYLELTQKGTLPRLSRPRRIEPGHIMRLDPATRRNLELGRTAEGDRAGSLLGTIDQTVTSAGARLLADRLAAPLTDLPAIRRRHDEIEALIDDADRREIARRALRRVPDLERALARLALGRGGPRDMLAVQRGLEVAVELAGLMEGAAPPLEALLARLPDLRSLVARLAETLVDEPPVLARDGGAVRTGMRPELDELRQLRDQSRRHVAALEARYREATAIPSLKIRHNNLLGYHIEVTTAHRTRVPDSFVQRQSMATATRYTTVELGDLESRIANAADQALALELAILAELQAAILAAADGIATTASVLAELDVTAGLARLAQDGRWTRPVLTDAPVLRIEGGRHPVVEAAVMAARQPFVANPCTLGPDNRLWLVTGPNMAGKSTFLRQTALIVILAQMGSFVPAAAAEIGIVDRLFSRVGAADDLARGRSTFMVEMVETATILNQATSRSFVILDEIGRGTATYDGLSLAWAVVEHLHEVTGARGLFATHYHELTALAARLPALSTWTMRVKEWRGQVVFLHEVAQGTADRSYGIHVAKLAGLPPAVIARAEEVLKRLEQDEPRSTPALLALDLPLFRAAARPQPTSPGPAAPSPLEAALAAIDPDELTPRAALDLVFRLKGMMG